MKDDDARLVGPFLFSGACRRPGQILMQRSLDGNRSFFLASGTLIVACLCTLPAWAAHQDSSTASAKAPASTKSAHPTTKKSTTHQAHPLTTSKAVTKSTTYSHSGKHSHKKSSRVRGQQKIDSERARSIQEALIREHYLSGEPSDTWNQESEDAMRRYQDDHGWQTKEVPDSRALIKLGLGPSHDHLLNPESAMTTSPDAPRSVTTVPVSNPPTPATATPVPTSPAQSDPPNPQ